MAIAQRAPSVVTGTEHFADALSSMACAAIPVTDGAGETIGVIDLTCTAEDFNPLLLPFAKRTAQGIGDRLREGTGLRRLPVRSWLSLTDTERAVAHLVAQGLSSRAVADHVRLSPSVVRSHLRRVFRKLGVRSRVDALREVREISRGIHPAMLSERGLVPVLKALARRSPVPVDLTLRIAGRLPDHVELGAYYIVSEALANVAKHADAEMVVVSVEAGPGALSLSVRDDGVGGADPNGSGLSGLRQRAEALGGTLNLTSPPGRGTSVEVRLPVPAI